MNQFEDTTHSPKKDYSIVKNIVPLLLVFFLGLGAGFIIWGLNPNQSSVAVKSTAAVNPETTAQANSETKKNAQTPAADPTQQKIKRYDVPVDDDPSDGPATAPITIIEFSDFECPFCTKWHEEVWSKLKEAYPGKVRLVYRDFPLFGMHENAGPAAEAANCSGDQGKYWEYHDKLFTGGKALSSATFENYAKELKLELAKFLECTSSRKYKDEVQADYDYAVQLGVRSTPTFFVNGIPVVGAQPFEVFSQVVEKELAGANT